MEPVVYIDLTKHGVALAAREGVSVVEDAKTESAASRVRFFAIDQMTGYVVCTRARTRANPRAAVQFLHEVVRGCARSGLPLHIRTDQSPLFDSRLFAGACQQLGVVHHIVPPIAPSTHRKTSSGASKRRRK